MCKLKFGADHAACGRQASGWTNSSSGPAAVACPGPARPDSSLGGARGQDALLIALAERVRSKLADEATSAATIEECYRRFLRFAEKHPHEYRLLWGPAWSEMYGPGRPRPIKDWLLEKLAERYGGRPQDYERTYYALFFLIHGAASL